MATEAPKRTTYEGNCHCGNIKYTVTLPDALAPNGKGQVARCNCSICTKSGYLLVYPMREDVVWLGGSEARLKDYYMGKKNKAHRFCPECGSSVLIDFKNSDIERQRSRLAVSARLFKNIDLKELDYSDYDGFSELDPPYEV